jgi:hypothetical protein
MNRKAESFPTRISTWAQLSELIEHFSFFNGHDWLFRGVTDVSHGLRPKIGRDKTRAMKFDQGKDKRSRVPYRLDDERAVLSMFIQQATPHLRAPPQLDLEWLSIAQHHGLPTRLLCKPLTYQQANALLSAFSRHLII